MQLQLAREVALLERMTVKQLREKYAEVFGEATNGNNRTWLRRRIAWRLQALAGGDLSERAKSRAAELARDADIRLIPPKQHEAVSVVLSGPTKTLELRPQSDERLPPPGTVLTRNYKGEVLQVKVLDNGFEFAGHVYGSLSAVAKAVTGSHCNGFHFFRLTATGGAA